MTSTTPESISPDLAERQLEAEAVLQAPSDDEVEIVDYQPPPLAALREAWRYRRVAVTVFWETVGQQMFRYRLGPTWLVVQTFMSLAGFSLIFGGGIFNVQAPNGMPYFLYMMVGMMGWQLFSQTLVMSTRAFQFVRILKNFHLPLLLIPIAGSAPALIRFVLYLIGYGIAIVYLWLTRGKLYFQESPKLLLLSAFGLALCLLFAWGIGMWTAPLFAWARDMRFVIRYALPFWMFLTPILYPIDHLHGSTRTLAEANPLSSAVEMVKVGLLGVGSVRVYAAAWSIGGICLVFLSGVWFITRFGHSLAPTTKAFDEEEELL
jgi:ABC-type polysaccharide/polyol phosphate export permease